MKTMFKSTCAAALLAGAAIAIPAAATAGVDVSVSVGAPALVYSPGPGYSPYEGQIYYDPIYFDGAWYHGPYRWRMRHGVRVFWLNGGWHRNEWYGRPIPASLTFRNGGYLRSGRFGGFGDADHINARFVPDRGMEHGDRPDMKSDRGDMREDRGDMRRDRGPKAAPAPDNGRRNDPRSPHN